MGSLTEDEKSLPVHLYLLACQLGGTHAARVLMSWWTSLTCRLEVVGLGDKLYASDNRRHAAEADIVMILQPTLPPSGEIIVSFNSGFWLYLQSQRQGLPAYNSFDNVLTSEKPINCSYSGDDMHFGRSLSSPPSVGLLRHTSYSFVFSSPSSGALPTVFEWSLYLIHSNKHKFAYQGSPQIMIGYRLEIGPNFEEASRLSEVKEFQASRSFKGYKMSYKTSLTCGEAEFRWLKSGTEHWRQSLSKNSVTITVAFSCGHFFSACVRGDLSDGHLHWCCSYSPSLSFTLLRSSPLVQSDISRRWTSDAPSFISFNSSITNFSRLVSLTRLFGSLRDVSPRRASSVPRFSTGFLHSLSAYPAHFTIRPVSICLYPHLSSWLR